MLGVQNDLLDCFVESVAACGECGDCQKRPYTRYLTWYDRTHGLSAEAFICGRCLLSREASERRMNALISLRPDEGGY